MAAAKRRKRRSRPRCRPQSRGRAQAAGAGSVYATDARQRRGKLRRRACKRKRRKTIPRPVLQPVPPAPTPPRSAPPGVTLSSPVAIYGGIFGPAQAERLLWRAGFGPSPGHAQALAAMGLHRAVASLTRPVGPATLTGAAPVDGDGRSLAPADLWGHDQLWFLDRMVRTNQPLVERMTLVWHDWFATSNAGVSQQNLMQGLTLGWDLSPALAAQQVPVACVSRPDQYDFWSPGVWGQPEERMLDAFGNLGEVAGGDAGLLAFQRDLESRGLADRVLTHVWSEFGRRPVENGSGTDHGAAGVGLVMGSRAAGTMVGEFPGLVNLDEDDNLRNTSDFRSVYCGLLEDWLEVDAGPIIPGAGSFAKPDLVRA